MRLHSFRYGEWRQGSGTQSSDVQYHSCEDVSFLRNLLPGKNVCGHLVADHFHYCSVADIIRSCLGPKAMLKMLLDPMGGIVLTNDGHAILREIEVAHPAAKSMIELSRTQDEEVGDGTTTVIVLGAYSYTSRTKNLFARLYISNLLSTQPVKSLPKLYRNSNGASTP